MTSRRQFQKEIWQYLHAHVTASTVEEIESQIDTKTASSADEARLEDALESVLRALHKRGYGY